MHWIIEFIVRYRNFCSLLVTSVISLWMISGTPLQQARTARVLTITVFYPMQLTFDQIGRISNIFAENRRLREEVTSLRMKVSLLEEKALENDRLRGMLNFSQEFSYTLIPVRVVARDPSPVNRSIIVNAGRNDGVEPWMPVVGEKGVVGKVVNPMQHMSMVQLLTDPANRTSVQVRRTRTIAILETEDGNDFFIKFRSHEPVEPGDTVVTSGLGGIYPRGMMVGTVTKIEKNHNPLFRKGVLKLSLNFGHVEELFIVKLSPQWAAFKSELDSLKGMQ